MNFAVFKLSYDLPSIRVLRCLVVVLCFVCFFVVKCVLTAIGPLSNCYSYLTLI